MRALVLLGLMICSSVSFATGWSIEGGGVSLIIAGDLGYESYPESKGGGWKAGVMLLSDYSVNGNPPVCYMLVEGGQNRLIYCEERKDWRLSRTLYLKEGYGGRFECVKNCLEDTPKELLWVEDEPECEADSDGC